MFRTPRPISSLLLLTALLFVCLPRPLPAMVPLAVFEQLRPGMSRGAVYARVGQPDEQEGGHPVWLLTESADFARGLAEFAGDTLEVLTVIYKPGRTTLNELLQNFSRRGMQPRQRRAGGAVYRERNLQSGQPEVRLIQPSPDNRLAGPRLSVMSEASWQRREKAGQMQRETPAVRFRRLTFGMEKGAVLALMGQPDESDGEMQLWNLHDSAELLYGMVEYRDERVSLLGGAYKPGILDLPGLAARLQGAGLTPIGRTAEQMAFLRAATEESSEEVYLLQPPEDAKTSGPLEMRMTRAHFDALDEEDSN